MLIDQNLKNLFAAILKDDVNGETFSNLVLLANVKLDDQEWDVPNKLLEKSEELSHLLGGKETRTLH